MCTFTSDQEVMVCDIAIGRVRAELGQSIPDLEFREVRGQGTLVRTASARDASRFRRAVQAALDAVNPPAV